MTFKINAIDIDIDIDKVVDKVLDAIDESCNDAVCNCFESLGEVDDFFYDNEDEFDEMVNYVKELVTKKLLEE